MILGAVVLPLLLVLSPVGSSTRGSQAWFQLGSFQLQPSEFAKVGLIVFVASYCAAFRGELDARRLATVLGLSAIPMGLIYKQPDLGTALVFVAILMGMLLVAGARPRHMAALTLVGLLGVVGVVHLGVLKAPSARAPHGLSRSDEQPASERHYNPRPVQDRHHHGRRAGGRACSRTQTNLSYVPEQHTDFIFTVVGEETGFRSARLALLMGSSPSWSGPGEQPPWPKHLCGHPDLRGRPVDAGVPDLRERRHDDGDHAHHRDPAALHEPTADLRPWPRSSPWASSSTSTCAATPSPRPMRSRSVRLAEVGRPTGPSSGAAPLTMAISRWAVSLMS